MSGGQEERQNRNLGKVRKCWVESRIDREKTVLKRKNEGQKKVRQRYNCGRKQETWRGEEERQRENCGRK